MAIEAHNRGFHNLGRVPGRRRQGLSLSGGRDERADSLSGRKLEDRGRWKVGLGEQGGHERNITLLQGPSLSWMFKTYLE